MIIDGATKLFVLEASDGNSISVQNVYSRWKDWVLLADNSKWPQAFLGVGGEDIDVLAGTKIPLYAFLANGWRVRPREATHTLNVTAGVLLVEGGGDPFVNTLGAFVVRINYQQPVQAITVATGGGGGASANDIALAVWAAVVDGSITAQESIRLMNSVLGGRVTGAGSGTERFRDLANTKDRIVSTVDSGGNRTNVTTDLT
jgi:hypothetical protein